MAKTRFLPMFPLRIVVFPREKLNLHIFEPRYKQLLCECEKDGITFGIPSFINDKMMEIGTEVRLLKIQKKYENGEMDVCTEGVRLFKIVDFYNQAVGKMYGAADIMDLKSSQTVGDFETNEDILLMVNELFGLMKIQKKLPDNGPNFSIYDIAHHVGFNIEQEYAFLCIESEKKRQEYIYEHLQRILPVVREMEFLRQKAILNGHFKDLKSPNF